MRTWFIAIAVILIAVFLFTGCECKQRTIQHFVKGEEISNVSKVRHTDNHLTLITFDGGMEITVPTSSYSSISKYKKQQGK